MEKNKIDMNRKRRLKLQIEIDCGESNKEVEWDQEKKKGEEKRDGKERNGVGINYYQSDIHLRSAPLYMEIKRINCLE